MTDPVETAERWRVKKEVPLALLFAISSMFVGQIAVGVMWASKLESAVMYASTERVGMLNRIEKLEINNFNAVDRLTRVEVKMEAQNILLGQILAAVKERP